jgi:mannose-6-phosphate isomerase-like protein (cupin superfamily)
MNPMSLMTVLRCVDIDEMIRFVREQLDGRVERISPADSPAEVVMTVAGTSVCIRRHERDEPVHLVLLADADATATTLTAPNGTTIEIRPEPGGVVVPPSAPSLSVVRSGGDFGVGRAGMEYRDLLPDRWGGRFIASNIRIVDEGPVPDVVHAHRIRFQMIFCARGWVDVVYEDQGPAFRLHAGDCVLQPPGIRHRVLRNSADLEVIEIGCPAVHDTIIDHDLVLPTAALDPDREFAGQRFVRHVAADATRTTSLVDGMRMRDTGIGSATRGLAGARVIEAEGEGPTDSPNVLTHAGEFVMIVVLRGAATLTIDDHVIGPPLEPLDAVALPPGSRWCWTEWSGDLEFLEVSLPEGTVRPLRSPATAVT